MPLKKYLDRNVYEAAEERLKTIFQDFEKIIVSFSGGKDSGVLFNLALDYVKKNNINKKIGVFFIDLEAQYNKTIEYIRRMIFDNKKYLEIFWCCMPLNLRNATSVFSPFWTCWDQEQKDKWVRPYPQMEGVYTYENNPFDFFKYKMEFEQFDVDFANWYSQGAKTACLVGIRSDESLNRFRTISSEVKTQYKNMQCSTRISKTVYNFYPIYDWRTEDIWTANYKFDWDYNRLYDLFYQAGLSIHQMRICQPYGDDQRIGLNLYKIIEPETWLKVVNRVSGANFGNIYCGNNIMGYQKVILPKGHTWKSYTKLLLATLPKELRNHYVQKFIKFIKYWNKKGSYIPNDIILQMDGVKTSKIINNRGNKKPASIFTRIPDSAPGKIEANRQAPTWRRMAICIIKNDVVCKSLSFSQTKEQQDNIARALEKYRNL